MNLTWLIKAPLREREQQWLDDGWLADCTSPGNWKALKLVLEGPSGLLVVGYQDGKVVKPSGEMEGSAHLTTLQHRCSPGSRIRGTLSPQHQEQCLAYSSILIWQMNGGLRSIHSIEMSSGYHSLSIIHPLSIQCLRAYRIRDAKPWAAGDSMVNKIQALM